VSCSNVNVGCSTTACIIPVLIQYLAIIMCSLIAFNVQVFVTNVVFLRLFVDC
jgi:hypothetical protein